MGNYEYMFQEMMSEMENVSFDFDILGLVSYIFLALGLYAIAQRRGISKPWLAWIPVANVWLLGCISDQYRYVARGEVKSKRKVLLGLELAILALAIVLVVMVVAAFFNVMGSGIEIMDESLNFTKAGLEMIVSWLPAVGVLLVMMVVAVVQMILTFSAYHDIFASCDPNNKTLFTVLGVVLSFLGLSVVMSILVFVCRNKDGGMPPRMQQPMEQPMVEQPVWQPPQPPKEPWEN